MEHMPHPVDIGYNVAWVKYASRAFELANGMGIRQDNFKEPSYQFAQDVEPGQDIREHELFEPFVFYAARKRILPKIDRQGRIKDGSVLMEALGDRYPLAKTKVPEGAEHVEKRRLLLQKMVTVSAIERLGLARHVRRRRLATSLAVAATAAYFNANIRFETDRAVYEHVAEIEKADRAFAGILQRHHGHEFIYRRISRNSELVLREGIAQPDGTVKQFSTVYDAFWNEIAVDRKRFQEKRERFIVGLQTRAGNPDLVPEADA